MLTSPDRPQQQGVARGHRHRQPHRGAARFTLVVDLMSLISRLARAMPSIALSSASP